MNIQSNELFVVDMDDLKTSDDENKSEWKIAFSVYVKTNPHISYFKIIYNQGIKLC